MQRLGQHFLKNQAVVKNIITSLDLTAIKHVVEIGPGHGELTETLLEACASSGVELVVIEKDAQLAEGLKKLLSSSHGLHIVHADALTALPEVLERFKGDSYAAVGNIPYYITGHFLRLIGELDRKPNFCTFMVQREVAERATDRPPRMNRLAASIQFWANTSIKMLVPKKDFSPPPKVDSAILHLKTLPARKNILESSYYAMVRTVFAQPRKTILNNIAQKSGLARATVAEKIRACGVDPEARPQNLTIENIISLTKGDFDLA